MVMKKSTRNVLSILGVVVAVGGLAVFLLRKPGQTAAEVFSNATTALRSGFARAVDTVTANGVGIVSAKDPQTGIITAKAITSPEEGVGFINQAIQSGQTIQRTSKTLASAGDTVTFQNKTFTLPPLAGIAQLADGSTVAIQVKNVLRDKSGLSALDRRNISNIQAARQRGENPLVPNALARFV